MKRFPLAALTAVSLCTTILAACSVTDLAPIPTIDLPAVPAQSSQPVYDIAQVQDGSQPVYAVTPAEPAYAAAPAQPAPVQPSPQPAMMAAAAPAPGNGTFVSPEPVSWGFPASPGHLFRSDNSGLSMSETQCRKELKRMGVKFRDIAPIRDSASCGIDHPVEVSSLGRTIGLKPAAKLNCQMALEAAKWAQRDLAPAARSRYLSGVSEIRQLSSYSCRRISGSRTISEHAKGNALDIGSIKLKNGRVIDVAKPSLFAMRERSFLRKVRGEACDRFGTVLGPGYNRDHADHFHLDLRERRRTACH